MNTEAGEHTGANISTTMFLVVEENPAVRDMIQAALVKGKAREIKHVTGVKATLDVLQLRGKDIGCVVCDADMVSAGGLGLLRMIRSGALGLLARDTCVVLLTSRTDPAVAASAAALDVNGMAVAPFSAETLGDIITTALNRSVLLNRPTVYAAVPLVDPPAAATEKSSISSRGVVLHKKEKAEKGAPAVAAANPKPVAKPGLELKNVKLRTLVHVQPGAILARDLLDGEGHLLIKTGTKLTASMLERLKDDHAKGDASSYHLWVGEIDKSS
ncbi:MAG: response regulator [Rhodospirillaceae bacterium]|nr:response regulator [Rhodospirillaceae bacterium]